MMIAFPVFCSSIFAGWQIALIVIAAILIAGVIALNVWLAYIWRVKAERRMYDEDLQNRRDALVAKLEYLKGGGEAEPQNWVVFARFDEDDEDDEEEEPIQPTEDGNRPFNTVILEVDTMSPRMRNKLGMRPKRFDGKKFYVRYSLGFEAKLRLSDDETKKRYIEICDEIRSYDGVTIEKGFSRRQITRGGELLGCLTFLGKRLCVAFALSPEDYADGKYHGEDKSDKKRFAKTPLLVRILSDNKTETVKYLFAELAEKHSMIKGKVKSYKYDLTEKSQTELVVSGAVRVIIVDEVRQSVEVPVKKTSAVYTGQDVAEEGEPKEEAVNEAAATENVKIEEEN